MTYQSGKAPASSRTHVGEHHEDFSDTNLKITRASWIYSICAALNSVNLGFDMGTTTNVGPLVEAHFGLTVAERELFVGSLNFWAIFGGLMSNWICDKYG